MGAEGRRPAEGDADLVILDPDREWRITEDSLQYLNRISAFVGLEGRGVPETVLVRGQVVWGGGAVRVSPGYSLDRKSVV